MTRRMAKCSSEGARDGGSSLERIARSMSYDARRAKRSRLTRARPVLGDSDRQSSRHTAFQGNTLSSSLSTIPLCSGAVHGRTLVKGHTVSNCTPRFGNSSSLNIMNMK
ncbi:unnamed protein product [Caenorhabditis auriculariae]|uniref:Uncharacterized protein n=1 Tax=Caenorhabditis auriculariae TaxID=2777116 RepID=A0A8S1GTL9_9PELO|nr:unnamed protein product [Caenorhabditis auriculariae]